MFIKRVKHHQWLHTAIPLKTKLGQISSDSIRIQGPSKRPSSSRLYPVSSVKERNRKGGKCKISRVLQSPVSSTQASPKVEASHRPKQAQHFSTRRKVQNGNARVHQDFLIPGEWVSSIDPSDAQVFTMIVKEVKLMALSRGLRLHQYLDDWLIRSQSQEEAQVNSGRPDSVLGLDSKSGKIRTETYSGVFVRGLRIPSRFGPCKTHSRQMAQTSEFNPMTQVKTCFDCKMFDVSNWVACLNGENGPGGTPSHETLSVSSPGALEISSVAGQPPSLDRYHFCTPRLVAEPCNVMKGSDLHPKDHSIQLFTDASNEGWGAHLDQSSTKGLWSDQEKRLHINVLELKAVSLALRSFKDQCQNQTVLVATDNSTVVTYVNKEELYQWKCALSCGRS